MLNLNSQLTLYIMKFEKPPKFNRTKEILEDYLSGTHNEFLKLTDERYFYWDELKYRKNLPYSNSTKAWTLVKMYRQANYKKLTFGSEVFSYSLTTNIQKNLHEFDLKLIVGLYKSPITDFERTEYLKNSILEEAIASSQVEGAATTTKVAFEMLKSGRSPRNESEQMIFNNLRSINMITEYLSKPLNKELIIKIHKTMTASTSAEICAGSFRTEQIYVQDFVDGEIAHTPPNYGEIHQFIEDLCEFANTENEFIHPIIKASIIHFMFGYIHPFLDGNGRTARALFYWYLLKKDYSLVKNISISRAILNSRVQYDKAFLKTENDDNDLTYFINYSIKNLRTAFEALIKYRDKKKDEEETSNLISYKLMNRGLTKRQADLIGFLYTRPKEQTSISKYCTKCDVVRQTARKDLKELITLGLLTEEKNGRNIWFSISSKQEVLNYLEK